MCVHSTRADRFPLPPLHTPLPFKTQQARKALPDAVASEVCAWLDIEAAPSAQTDPRVYVSRETLYHDLFRKSVHAVSTWGSGGVVGWWMGLLDDCSWGLGGDQVI